MMRSDWTMIELQSGDIHLQIDAQNGGILRRLTYKDQHILRPMPLSSNDPLDSAAFPLFPFSGRIAEGRFTHCGQHFRLPLNIPTEIHAIHGQAWQGEWSVEETTEKSVLISYNHKGDIWPWPYTAQQRFTIKEQTLLVELSLMNNGTDSMPAGMGWHPYFPRGDAHLKAAVSHIWPVDNDKLPLSATAIKAWCDLTANPKVNDLHLDNPFSLDAHSVTITWPQRGLIADMHWDKAIEKLVVYTPEEEDFFCVEPVSHIPNSVNSKLSNNITGHRILAPGETMSSVIKLSITEA